jgi:hypothetical protein
MKVVIHITMPIGYDALCYWNLVPPKHRLLLTKLHIVKRHAIKTYCNAETSDITVKFTWLHLVRSAKPSLILIRQEI